MLAFATTGTTATTDPMDCQKFLGWFFHLLLLASPGEESANQESEKGEEKKSENYIVSPHHYKSPHVVLSPIYISLEMMILGNQN
jgi:hypothetical protein